MTYMNMLTLRINDQLDQQLSSLSTAFGSSKSDIARDALHKHIFTQRLEVLRAKGVPLAQAQGVLTDEDVFAIAS